MQPMLDHLGEIGHRLLLKYDFSIVSAIDSYQHNQIHVHSHGFPLSLRCGIYRSRNRGLVQCELQAFNLNIILIAAKGPQHRLRCRGGGFPEQSLQFYKRR